MDDPLVPSTSTPRPLSSRMRVNEMFSSTFPSGEMRASESSRILSRRYALPSYALAPPASDGVQTIPSASSSFEWCMRRSSIHTGCGEQEFARTSA